MIERKHLIIVLALLAAPALASAVMYSSLPDPAPIHWNVRGEADGFGPRWVLAWLLPASTTLVTALLLALPALGPMRENMARFRNVYGKLVIAIVATVGAIHVLTLLSATGAAVRIEVVVPFVMGLLFAVLGNWMGKIRRNFWVGIRTPWTLASDVVWERTHRVGGRLFVALGLLVAIVALLGHPWLTIGTLIGGLIALLVWSLVYSLWLYQRVGPSEGSIS